MTLEKATAEDDLAFIRKLIAPDSEGRAQRDFGKAYAMWGLAFSLPLLPEWARSAGLIALPTSYWPIAAVAITLLITVAMIAGARGAKPAVGMQARAKNAVFGGVGFANLAVLIGLILVSYRLRDGRIMMLHAVVVFAFQGAAWYAVWALRKRPMALIVSLGWIAFAILLGALIPGHLFILAAAIGLFVLMVIPGVILARTPVDA